MKNTEEKTINHGERQPAAKKAKPPARFDTPEKLEAEMQRIRQEDEEEKLSATQRGLISLFSACHKTRRQS